MPNNAGPGWAWTGAGGGGTAGPTGPTGPSGGPTGPTGPTGSAGAGGGVGVSISGNTAGTPVLISSGTGYFAGGNNVTLSQNGSTISINAQSQSVQTQASGNIGATGFATTTQAGTAIAGTNNTAGFTLGVPAFITAQSVQTQASGNIAGTGVTTTTQGGTTLGVTQNTAGLSLAIPPWVTAGGGGNFSGGVSTGGNTAGATGLTGSQLVFAGGNNITLSQTTGANGATVSIIGGAAGGVNSASLYAASNTTQGTSGTQALSALTFAGAGNVSVGVTNGSVVISGATAAGLTSGGGYVQGNTTGQSSSTTFPLTSFNVSAAGLISAGWSASTLVISAPATTGITQSLYAASNTTQGSSGTQSIGSLVMAGAGIVSVGVSNGSYVISATGGGGGGAAVTVGGNSTSAGAGYSNISSGTLFLAGGNNITLSQNGASVTISGGAGGGGGIAASIGGNSTSAGGGYSNITSGTAFLLGGPNITLSQNGASISISAASQSVQTQASGNIAATGFATTTTNGSVILGTHNTTGFTLAVPPYLTAGVTTQALYFGGNTTGASSSSTAGDQTLSYSMAGGISGGWTNGSVVISGPPVSSISGTGLVSISVNGSTISIGVPGSTQSVWAPYWGSQTPVQIGNGTIQVYPANMDRNFSASRADIYASISASLVALSTYAGTVSAYVGIYTRNGSTLSLASSGSQSYSFSNSSNLNFSAFTGIRNLSVPINVNGSPQDAWFGVMTQSASANTNAWTASNMLIPGNAAPLAGFIGSSANATQQQMLGLGVYSVSSAALPSSMAFSGINGTASAAAMMPMIAFHNVTA